MSKFQKIKQAITQAAAPARTEECNVCPGCHKVIREADLGDPLTEQVDKRWWHRPCLFATTQEYRLIDRALRLHSDYKADPETALADLIGDLGHYATLKGIDFEESMRRGMQFWLEETPVKPAVEE
jgi:hypothetical protein